MKKIRKDRVLAIVFVVIVALIVLLGLLAIAQRANAEQVSSTVSWEQKLAYEDGSAMPATDIAGFEVHYTVNTPFKAMDKPVLIPNNQRNHKLMLELKPAKDPVLVRIAVRTKSIYGTLSEFSNVIEDTFVVNNTLKPVAPIVIGLKVVCVDSTCEIVYQSVQKENVK